MRSRSCLFLTAAALLAACATVQPDARTQAIREAFKQADLNGDEKLSPEEFARLPLQNVRFTDVDSDDNGVVTLVELRSYLDWRRIAAEGNRPLDRDGRPQR